MRFAIIRFAKWLRREFEFPIRVPINLLAAKRVRTVRGDLCTASFFAPWSQRHEPHIRIATGDWLEASAEQGRNNALAGYLCALAHEVIHYRQWVETGKTWERGVPARAGRLVNRYALTVDGP